jgi:hypothetical protein
MCDWWLAQALAPDRRTTATSSRDNSLSRLRIPYFNLNGMDFSGEYSLSAGGYSVIEISRGSKLKFLLASISFL